ncbi:MAG: response regulator transcription factor [Candidatus Aminicenantales bacterium]|jgi:DNA-binding NarL/FixJ family response regulator
MRPKILVVEDEVIIAESLRRSLESSGYDVPEICATAEAAIEAARTYAPDLVLMDIRLKGEKDGIYAARIVSEGFDVPVIFVTAYGDDAVLERAKRTRPAGYLLKPFRSDELKAAIETALYRHMIEGGFPQKTENADKPRRRKTKAAPLTPREKEVLRLLARGMANKEISAALAVSSRTVESHRAHILAKLKLKSAAELVRYAIRNGLIRS